MKLDASSLMAARAAILQKNAALQKAAGVAGGAPAAGGAGAPSFTQALNGALQQVNALQETASGAATAYERGETTDIAAVMLARESAAVGFQATLQVRNKLLSAYKDIMSMPV